MVLVGRIVFHCEHDRVGAHEPGDVVHVAVRVVADASLAEPDRSAHAEPLAEQSLVVHRGQPWVAHLDVAEQPFLGHEQQTLPVDIDAAAFEDNLAAAVFTVGRRPEEAP